MTQKPHLPSNLFTEINFFNPLHTIPRPNLPQTLPWTFVTTLPSTPYLQQEKDEIPHPDHVPGTSFSPDCPLFHPPTHHPSNPITEINFFNPLHRIPQPNRTPSPKLNPGPWLQQPPPPPTSNKKKDKIPHPDHVPGTSSSPECPLFHPPVRSIFSPTPIPIPGSPLREISP
ncbi:hypothetical protein CDAR_582491 [Caerostris darwini]|uniref:Uncharacterized protein n=1 Tax=Caerostris darwini TaxID=1538125 RepID=A0AAV4RGX4_9ARAC|nr:hypothetical protein CDAR_582491 [Caerostris darwini]